MSIMLDSDIVIEVLRLRDQDILSKWQTLAHYGGAILYSPVTVAEVWAGARPHEHDSISRFFAPLKCAPANHPTGKLAGDYLRSFARSHSLAVGDALIAATSVQSQALLWTRNRKHYPMPDVSFY
jgi:hypothetical protein